MHPDPEALVIAYLAAHPDVAALTDEISTHTPPSTHAPWVRVSLIDETADGDSRALHLMAAFMQFDCYGSDDRVVQQSEASLLGRTVREALNDMPGAYDGAIVTAVTDLSARRLADTAHAPAWERWIVSATVSLHP